MSFLSRAKFNLRFQKENESVDNFITDLFTLAQHCNYGTLHDQMVRDRIVVGLKDKTLSEKLQLEADLTLEKAINQARQKELVRQQQGIIRQEGPGASNVDRVKSTRPRPKGKFKTSFKSLELHEWECQNIYNSKNDYSNKTISLTFLAGVESGDQWFAQL